MQTLPKAQLFARLAGGLASGVTVITPNIRLAQSLAREFDASQAAAGRASWESADVLPYSAFIGRLYQDALYSELARGLPILLTPAQEQALWEDAIRASKLAETLLSAASAAAQCREAWQLAHAWGLAPKLQNAAGNEDAQAFLDWSARFERSCERNRQTDAARLPGLLMPLLVQASLRKPKTLVFYGFDIVTVEQRAFCAALEAAGVELFASGPQAHADVNAGVAKRLACTAARDEILACARWARSRLEQPSPRRSPSEGEGATQPSPRPSPSEQPSPQPSPWKGEGASTTPSPRLRGEGRGEGPPRIGIVVPDLAKSRAAVHRIFASVMQPAYALPGAFQTALPGAFQTALPGALQNALPGADKLPLPFNISLGLALSSFPLAHDALLALELAGREIEFARASRLLRSPFLAGADAEMAARARLDAALRERAGTSVTLDGLLRLMSLRGSPPCAILAKRLSQLAEFRKANLFGAKPASEWAKAMSAALDLLGFPGERVLDSTEFQTAKKWREVLAGFAALDRVQGKMRYADACQRLARMAADTLFQPEAHDVPIQILGVLESAGLEFDHLWVMGLTVEVWPLPARPNPFVPVALQRAAGVPEADAAASFELDERITAGWCAAAGEVVFSHPLREGDRELAASPLIAGVAVSAFEHLGVPAYPDFRGQMAGEPTHREAMQGALPRSKSPRGILERISGHFSPALAVSSEPHSGGTGVFRDQAACPFRAFAAHRLGAESLKTPEPGLSLMDRGSLLHSMMHGVWTALVSKAKLDAMSAADLAALLERSADAAIAKLRRAKPEALQGRIAALEKSRLAALARDWLEYEKQRPAFMVAELEEKHPVAFGGVAVNARLDRMDKLGAGGYAILDYKTGAASVSAWLGPRPDEPQLPLYATASDKDIAAVTFARVKTGDMEFTGIAREKNLLPDVKTMAEQRSAAAKAYGSWDELRAGWRRELELLGQGFASGDARVDPKHGEDTCKFCGRQPLCRINERSGDV